MEQSEYFVVIFFRCEMVVIRPPLRFGEMQSVDVVHGRLHSEAISLVHSGREVGTFVETHDAHVLGILLHDLNRLCVVDSSCERKVVLNHVEVLGLDPIDGLLDVARDSDMSRRLNECNVIENAVRLIEIVDVLSQPIEISRLLFLRRFVNGDEQGRVAGQALQEAQRIDGLVDDAQRWMRGNQRGDDDEGGVDWIIAFFRFRFFLAHRAGLEVAVRLLHRH
mmetsp:Transcript_22948/g.63934  ORF Transcript_22948/g.63934 Transcript_22948/m.63934 type:complete len:222 (-) Transcript_22948:329-994(-)